MGKLYGMPGHVFDGFYRVEGDLADRARWKNCPMCNPNGERDRVRSSNGEDIGKVHCPTCERPPHEDHHGEGE